MVKRYSAVEKRQVSAEFYEAKKKADDLADEVAIALADLGLDVEIMEAREENGDVYVTLKTAQDKTITEYIPSPTDLDPPDMYEDEDIATEDDIYDVLEGLKADDMHVGDSDLEVSGWDEPDWEVA